MFFVRFVIICKDTVNDFLGKNCPYLAAAISFYTLFSLFPLILAVVSVLGFILGSPSHETRLAKEIANQIPVSTQFVGETIQGVVKARHVTGIVSILGLMWAGTAVFGAIRKGVNAAWGIRKTRPFLHERLIDFSLTLGAGVLILVSVFTSVVQGYFRDMINQVIPTGSTINFNLIWGQVTLVIPATFSLFTFVALYRFLPNAKVRFKDVWFGALLATAAFEVVKHGFVWYVSSSALYNVVYGSIGAMVALLTWVYISAIILLFGALVTSRYAAYLATREPEEQGIKCLWTGLERVRLRVVESKENG